MQFLLELMRTIVFQLLCQCISLPEEVENLFTNYKNYEILYLKMILIYMYKKLEKKEIKKIRR